MAAVWVRGAAAPVLGIPCVPAGVEVHGGLRFGGQMPEEGRVMVQQDRQGSQPGAQREATPSRHAGNRVLAAARERYQGSLAQGFAGQLKAIDFSDQVMLFGAGLLVSALPLLILLSAFASNRVDDDISLRLGLDRRASGIMTHLFTSAPASLNVATATSLVFVTAGTLAVAGSLQQIYQKVFHQEHHGLRGLYRLPVWIAVLGLTVIVDTVVGRPVRDAVDGAVLAVLVTCAIWTLFFWWTMHFLLGGQVAWRRLLPSAVSTGVFFASLGVFSKFYFSSTIISDSKTYGTIGAVFSIMTWFVAIGAVIILGAVAGAAWQDRKPADPERGGQMTLDI
jgi:membrane protein